MLFETAKQFSSNGPLTLVVDGDCMFNTVRNGAKVQIERRGFYWPGDIVVYGRGDDRLVMHRFLGYVPGRRGWCGITWADEAKNAEATVAVGRILGKVMRIDQVPANPGTLPRFQSFIRYVVAVISWAGRVLVRFLKTIGIFRP